MTFRTTLLTLILAVTVIPTAHAKRPPESIPNTPAPASAGPTDGVLSKEPRFAVAAVNTTVLASYTFDVGATCTTQGWTVVDGTAQIALFWHVDDFAGANVQPSDNYTPLAGSKSLWCGARASAQGLTCGYLLLPGYGNRWNQVWQTKTCVPVTGNLDVSFLMEIDSEPAYDATFLEYTTDCAAPFDGWNELDGGIGVWDDVQTVSYSASFTVPSPAKVRLRFASDGGFSDEDANYESHGGPVVIDNLVVENLPLENFEDEALNATTSNDWEAAIEPGYGASYMALFSGQSLVQQDVCVKSLSCMWAAIQGSPETYACGGFPQQAAVPKGNDRGQYIAAEI